MAYAIHHRLEKDRLKAQRYRDANRLRVNEKAREKGRQNPEAKHAAERRWRKLNPEKLALVQKRVRDKRRHKRTEWVARRRVGPAMPAWADIDSMQDIYEMARLLTGITGIRHNVDHIVPITSDIVCGLHVPENLMVVTEYDNSVKRNRSWPGMP